MLFGLYLVVKYLGKEWINWLLQWYFTFAGVGSVGKVRTILACSRSCALLTRIRQSLISLARWTVGPSYWRKFDKSQILVLKGRRGMLCSTSL